MFKFCFADIYRTRCREGSAVMNKFPEDVAIAERLTGGDPDILRNDTFAPVERPDYSNIFGNDKKSGSPEKKSKLVGHQGKDQVSWKVKQLSPSANVRRGHPASPSLPVLQRPRQITHPRFVSEVKDDSDHVVRIRHQPVSTPSRDDQSGVSSPQYKCHLCDFTSSRLNVIVLHNKFHRADAANNGQGASVKGMSAIKSKSADRKSAGRTKGRASVSSPSCRSRARTRTAPAVCETPKAVDTADKGAPKRKLAEVSDTEIVNKESGANSKQQPPRSPEKQAKSSERKSPNTPKTPVFGKRKGSKWGGERPAKKKKNDEEIREKLLADWDDEDEEQEEKEIELMKQELSKSELANVHSADVTTASESESIAYTKPGCSEENVKPKKTSCFDFDDAEDANLGSELEERAKKFVENRKIPRILDDKSEAASKRWNITDDIKPLTCVPKVEEQVTDTSAVQVPETLKTEVDKPSADTEDMDVAFKTLLAETALPALPEVPELPATKVASSALDIGSSASLPDVVLDSSNSHTAHDISGSLHTVPELTSVDSSGGDHDYSIRKETEKVREKPKEIQVGSSKVHVAEARSVDGNSKTSLEEEEMELDINSMPVVMTDAIITEEPETSKVASVPVPLVDLIPSSTESHAVGINEGDASVTNFSTPLSSSETSVVMSKSSPRVPSSTDSAVMKAAQGTPVKAVKLQAAPLPVSSSVSLSATSKVKGGAGTTVISQKGGGGKFVIVQTSPGQQSRYTVGKATQQRVTQQQQQQQRQPQQHVIQQAAGGGKVVILAKPQGNGQQKILATALSPQQQRILTAGGKLQTQPQRIVTSAGTIINPRSVMAKGTQLTPVTQQQMKALQAGKQTLGAKFTMQSTQAKVVLPTMQKTSVTSASPVRVIGTLKPQSNTILIQTTQGTTVSGTVVAKPAASTSGQLQTKMGTSRSITKIPTSRPKILTSPAATASVQRISVPTTGGGKIVLTSQAQPKVLESRPAVAPGIIVQKVQSPLPAKASSVGLLTNVSQVKKVSGIFPRSSPIQKLGQLNSQTQSVKKISAPQSVQKVITSSQTIKKSVPQQKISDVNIISKQVPVVVSTTNVQSKAEIPSAQTLPSLQPLQPTVTVGPTVQQNLQPNSMVLSTPQCNVTGPNLAVGNSTTISLPSLQPTPVATTGGTSVLTPQQIAQVVAAAPTEQLADSGTATYVLVTIDDSGTLQSYDNSTLLTYDGGSQTSEGGARTLYIDPSSISTSGDLENIILTIDNSAASTGTVLNLEQTNTMPAHPVTSITVENSSTSPVFNIVSAPRAAGTAASQSGGSNQDILAEALANTQVFQSDSAIQDSLTVVNSSQATVMTPRLLEPSPLLTSSPSTLHQATVLLPSLSTVLPPPSNPAGVLETSLTLNQPIMTPLEVPSALPSLQAPPLPSLELPLTITQPALSVTSQSYSSIPVTACNPSEKSTAESSVSSSTLSLTMVEPRSVSAVSFNPSMPLIPEETDPQDEGDNSSTVISPNSSLSDKPQCHSDTSCSQILVNTSDNVVQEVASSHIEDPISSPAQHDVARHPVLTSYTDVPEPTSHDRENHGSELSKSLSTLDTASHHQISGSARERVVHSNERHTEPDVQSVIEHTSSAIQDHISGNTEILESAPGPTNSTFDGTSAIAVEDSNTSDINHSASSHLGSDQNSHMSYGRVSEINSQPSGSVAILQTERATTLSPFAEISEGASSNLENTGDHVLGINLTPSDGAPLENSSEMQSNSSLRNNQLATSDDLVHHTCYLQVVPESTSTTEEKMVTDNSSEQILQPSQKVCDTEALTSFQKAFKNTSEVSDSEPGNEATLVSCSAESPSSNVATGASLPLQSLSEVAHSMPLLVDEPMPETSNDCADAEQAMTAESPFREDDNELTKNMRLGQGER